MYPFPNSTFSRFPRTMLVRWLLMFWTMVVISGHFSRRAFTKFRLPGKTWFAVTMMTMIWPVARAVRTMTWRIRPKPESSS